MKISIKDLYQIETIKIDWKLYVSSALLMILLPPVISLPVSIVYFMKAGFMNKKATVQVMMAFACYIAVINCTKIADGDQANYWGVFEGVPQHGFWWAVNHIYGYGDATNGKEFMNGIYNYLGYWLTLGNYHLYIWINSILMYLPFFWGMKNLFEHEKQSKLMFITGMMILAFFPFFFVLSFQLQRQYLSYAYIIYLLVLKAKTGKTNMWMIIAMIFTHTTSVVYVPFLFFDMFYQRITLKKLFLLLAFMLPSFTITTYILGFFEDTESALGYIATRANDFEGATDGIQFKSNLYYLFSAPMIYITFKNIFKEGLTRLQYVFFNSYIFLFLFVVSLTGNELAQYRYSFFAYGYVGFILPYFDKSNKAVLRLMGGGMVICFFMYFPNFAWVYANNLYTLLAPQFVHLFIDTKIAPW